MRKFLIFNLKFLILGLFFTFAANAQSPFTTYITNPNVPGRVFTSQNFSNLVIGLSCWFIRFGIIAVGVMLVVYGLMFLMSRGNPTQFGNAKKAFGWGIVGGLVIFGVFTIVLTITAVLGSLTGKEVSYPITAMFSKC